MQVQGSPQGEYTLDRDETCYTSLVPAPPREHSFYYWVIPKDVPESLLREQKNSLQSWDLMPTRLFGLN